MLYLNPPYHIIEGVSVFADHADPLQFYYLPMMPKLTMLKDQKSGKRIPQIQVIKFRGRAGGGGFLNFDCNIGLEQGVIEDVRAELKRIHHLSQTPRLAPVPLVDGTVKMMLFGTQSGETPTAETPDSKFVLKIDHPARPALYGDNQAAFSVRLDQDGVVLLDKALQGEMSPIGIVYSLSFLGLRPAYHVKLNIDWNRVQKHMDETFSAKVFFSSTEITKAVDELIDNRAIDLQVDTFVPEGDDSTSGVTGRRDQAVNDVREMMTAAYFEPSLKPMDRGKDGWDKASQLAQDLSTMAVTGGWASVASFGYKKMDYKRMDRKVLNVNMSERTTVQRTIAPQGHLSGLFRIIKNEGLDINRFILSVDLDDPWFARRKVAVISRAAFEEDSVGSLNVQLRYNNEPKNVILDAANPRAELDWASLIKDGSMQREVTYDYKVSFKGVDSAERPISLTSKPQVVDVDNLEIDPRELYAIEYVPVIALGFPWKKYPNVEVQLRYADKDNAINQIDSYILSERKQEETWRMFVRDRSKLRFQYKLVYRAANHKDLTMSWAETDELQVVIRDPYRPRTLAIVPNFRWAEVARAFVDVSYEDKANKISESQSFEFKEDASDTQTFSADVANPDLRRVAYKVTVLYTDGRMLEIPPSYTRSDRIIVHDRMKGHKIVQVRPAPVNFLTKKVKEMVVETRYEDADAEMSASDIFNFKAMTDSGNFEYDYVDEAKPGYEWRVTYRYTNGMSKSTQWQKSTAEDLVVPVA